VFAEDICAFSKNDDLEIVLLYRTYLDSPVHPGPANTVKTISIICKNFRHGLCVRLTLTFKTLALHKEANILYTSISFVKRTFRFQNFYSRPVCGLERRKQKENKSGTVRKKKGYR
jgi:hypothetical protein